MVKKQTKKQISFREFYIKGIVVHYKLFMLAHPYLDENVTSKITEVVTGVNPKKYLENLEDSGDD